MPIKPEIKSFLLADMVIQEKGTNKWSAIGIFDCISSRVFPCLKDRLGLYIRLGDAEGDYDIRLEFCDESERKLAIFEGIRVSVPSRLITSDFGIITKDLPIQKPGKYLFNLYFNNGFVMGLPLTAEQITEI